MSRSTLLYILALVVCVVGVFLILKRGLTLTAPPDLSGEWHVIGDGSDDDAGATLGQTVFVEQSGRFVRFSFEGGLKINVQMVSPQPQAPPEGDGPATRQVSEIKYEGHDWRLSILGAGAEGPLVCRMRGPRRHTFTMTRVVPDEDEVLTNLPPVTPTTQPDDTVAIDAAPHAP